MTGGISRVRAFANSYALPLTTSSPWPSTRPVTVREANDVFRGQAE
ncbi:hypothetical protein [Nonomuraea sp. NPDC049158]